MNSTYCKITGQFRAKWPKLFCLLLIALFATSADAFRDTYPKNIKIDVINYAFKINLSDSTDEIVCEATVELRFRGAGVEELRLDLVNQTVESDGKGMRVSGVGNEGKELSFTHENNVLLIKLPKPSALNETGSYTIKYKGIPAGGLKIADNKYSERTFFSDNWPDKARNWLATVDHPYDKAKCEFIVTAPAHYQVVSNGLKIEETDLVNGMRLTHWKQGVPIAPWLYVLGVARFAVQYVDEFDGKSIQTWVYHQDRDAGFYDFADLTKKVLAFYSSSVGPYSYEKLANIQSNSVGGGMEAASAIFYGDKSVTGERSVRWRNVIIHEIAHQWFGNAVTEYDWDDVWLSEGFATYFTLLFIEEEYGREAFVEGLKSSKNTIDKLSADIPDYRIVHDNLDDMDNVVNQLTYQKGSWILHMLRGFIGKQNFDQGIQSYYKKYRDKNASTLDFRREMEEASGRDLSKFFDQWLYKPGKLEIKGTWKYDSGSKKLLVRLEQRQTADNIYSMPIQMDVFYPGRAAPQKEKLMIVERTNEFTIDVSGKPEKVILDPDLWVLMDSDFTEKEN